MSDQEKMREDFERKWILDMGEHCPLTIANVSVFFSNADAAHEAEKSAWNNLNNQVCWRNEELHKELEKRDAIIARQAEALSYAKEIAEEVHHYSMAPVDKAISASAESVAAWEAEHAAKVLEETKHRILAGRFLHDQAPPALFAREVASMLDRDIAELRAQSAQKKEE